MLLINSSLREVDQNTLNEFAARSVVREKIKEIEILSKNYEGLVLIDSYNDIGSAKLITNKIRNLGLIFEENENQINVFAGPFEKNDINLKIDFLIRNGYTNAQKYP